MRRSVSSTTPSTLRRWPMAVMTVMLAIFIWCTLLANIHLLTGIELTWFRAINNLPGWFSPIIVLITQAGSAVAVIIGVLLSYIRGYYELGKRLLLTGVSTYVVVTISKLIIGRPRPIEIIPDVAQRDLIVSGYGFPSGHAAVSAALCLTLLPWVPAPYRRWVMLLPFVVALSRIYLGVHAPLDVIGGLALGVAVAMASYVYPPTSLLPRRRARRRPISRSEK